MASDDLIDLIELLIPMHTTTEWRPYPELKAHLQKLVPADYEKECQCRQPNLNESDLAVKEDGVGSTIVATNDGDKKKKGSDK